MTINFTATPLREGLSAKTFNCLSAPPHYWVWGDSGLIDNSMSFGEEIHAFTGSPAKIAKLLASIVRENKKLSQASVSKHDIPRTFGLGYWPGKNVDLLVCMGITGREDGCPIKNIRKNAPEEFEDINVLIDAEYFSGDAPRIVWKLMELGFDDPSQKDDFYFLAQQLLDKDDPKLNPTNGVAMGGGRAHDFTQWISAQKFHAEAEIMIENTAPAKKKNKLGKRL